MHHHTRGGDGTNTDCRKKASVMLWAMFYWKTLGSGIYVKVIKKGMTYLYIVVDQVHALWQCGSLIILTPYSRITCNTKPMLGRQF